MRLVVVVLMLALTACQINHRSDQFACQNEGDCPGSQSCVDGFCVGGDPTPDDGPGPDPDGPKPDTLICPSQCTSCQLATMTCNVDCNQSPSTCLSAINCPPGFNCNILCTRNEVCANINCSQGASCNIQCKGNGTCDNVQCGPGKCDVECTGGQSCSAINCSSACACDVACGNNALCLQVACPDPDGPGVCAGIGLSRCTSERMGCNTCEEP